MFVSIPLDRDSFNSPVNENDNMTLTVYTRGERTYLQIELQNTERTVAVDLECLKKAISALE